MPSSIPFGFYQGARSEYLATYILSQLCIVTPIPHEGDFGLDLIGHLTRREGAMLEVGAPFGVQVKTVGERLRYPSKPGALKNREVRWLLEQAMPFLVATVERGENRLRLYCPWQLPQLKYDRGHEFTQIELVPETEGKNQLDSETGVARVPMGSPILDVTAEQVEGATASDPLRSVLRYWVQLDWVNQVNKQHDVCYVCGHSGYRPNVIPDVPLLLSVGFGSMALPSFLRRLAEVSTVTGLTLERTNDVEALARITSALELSAQYLDSHGVPLLERLRERLKKGTTGPQKA